MIDYGKEVVSALKTILPTKHELALTSNKDKVPIPCISWQERNNAAEETGDTLGYSRISFTIKVWGHEIELLNKYSIEIDNVLRPLGFKRLSTNELYDRQSTMKQKILNYEALALENFDGGM